MGIVVAEHSADATHTEVVSRAVVVDRAGRARRVGLKRRDLAANDVTADEVDERLWEAAAASIDLVVARVQPARLTLVDVADAGVVDARLGRRRRNQARKEHRHDDAQERCCP